MDPLHSSSLRPRTTTWLTSPRQTQYWRQCSIGLAFFPERVFGCTIPLKGWWCSRWWRRTIRWWTGDGTPHIAYWTSYLQIFVLLKVLFWIIYLKFVRGFRYLVFVSLLVSCLYLWPGCRILLESQLNQFLFSFHPFLVIPPVHSWSSTRVGFLV